jgi:hypothetical protein
LNIEKLFEEAVEEDDQNKLELFLQKFMGKWAFFYIQEASDNKLPVNSRNVAQIVTVSKENPINFLTIANRLGNNAVIYTSFNLAASLAEVECRIGKMKAAKAFDMYLNNSRIDGVYVQSNNCNVHIPKQELKRLVASYA